MRKVREVTLAELAAALGAEPPERDFAVDGIRPLDSAGPSHLSFLTQPKYVPAARESRAGAILVGPATEAASFQAQVLEVEDPHQALAVALGILYPEPPFEPGIDASARVAEDCEIGEGVGIGPYCVVGAGCRLGNGVRLHASVHLGPGCVIGEGSVLHPRVVLYDGVTMGAGCVIHAGAVLGADGFGFASHTGVPTKLRQVGRVVLGDQVEVGANSTIDRATLEETRIGAGTKIDNLVQVGHNVQIGEGCLLCGQAGIAGSATLGDRVVLAGQVGVSGHLRVGDGVQVAAKSAVLQDVEDGAVVAGIPAGPIRQWQRQSAALRKLAELRRRVAALERSQAEGDGTDD